MGSPLSGALACIYLEFLEAGPFQAIIPKDAHLFRYIDDALLIYPTHADIETIVTKLNNIEPSISFTYVCESNQTLPYLDINLHRTENSLERSVYRKTTNKYDHLHYYSHHNNKIKSGIIIGFYLRALRICTPQHLKNEEEHLEKSFRTLHYPTHFINQARKKAHRIHRKTEKKHTDTRRRIILPTTNTTTIISENLNKHQIDIAFTTSTTIKDIVTKKRRNTPISGGGIYKISCLGCNSIYVGETARNLSIRVQEHRRALISDNRLNALVQHRNAEDHNFALDKAEMLKYVHDKNRRRCIEASVISSFQTIMQRPGTYMLTSSIAEQILSENKIPNTNKTRLKSPP